MVTDHDFYMKLALEAAWQYQGLTYPNPAVGALLLSTEGKILAIGAHKKAGGPHAEVETLKAGFLALSSDTTLKNELQNLTDSTQIHHFLTQHAKKLFHGCTLYVTLEPCNHQGRTPPCSRLIASLGIDKLVIGSMDTNEEASGGCAFLESQGVAVVKNVMQASCDELLLPFNHYKKCSFLLFKHAQTLNGTIDGGYITGAKGLNFVHAMRDVCDLIVIGGTTVRSDRPTLDARRVDGKAPDVLIYSTHTDFDQSIPLFGVKGRKVIISSDLSVMEGYKNILIEGGGRMYEAVKDKIDMHLSIVSPILRQGLNFSVSAKERIVHQSRLGEDLLIWSIPLDKAGEL